jgi:hypothetical protein
MLLLSKFRPVHYLYGKPSHSTLSNENGSFFGHKKSFMKLGFSPGAMGLNLELRVKVFFSADSGTLGVAFHHPGG